MLRHDLGERRLGRCGGDRLRERRKDVAEDEARQTGGDAFLVETPLFDGALVKGPLVGG